MVASACARLRWTSPVSLSVRRTLRLDAVRRTATRPPARARGCGDRPGDRCAGGRSGRSGGRDRGPHDRRDRPAAGHGARAGAPAQRSRRAGARRSRTRRPARRASSPGSTGSSRRRQQRDPEAIALDYVRDHAAAFGLDGADLATLRLTSRTAGAGGSVHLVWEQRVDGVPNVDGGLQAAVTATAGCSTSAAARCRIRRRPPSTPQIERRRGISSPPFRAGAPAPPTGTARGAEQATPFLGGGEASLVLYRDRGADRLAWRVLYAASSDAFYDAIVDARTGVLQRRVNRTTPSRRSSTSTSARARAGDAAHAVADPGPWLDADDAGSRAPTCTRSPTWTTTSGSRSACRAPSPPDAADDGRAEHAGRSGPRRTTRSRSG